jgi:hypothetical protein
VAWRQQGGKAVCGGLKRGSAVVDLKKKEMGHNSFKNGPKSLKICENAW